MLVPPSCKLVYDPINYNVGKTMPQTIPQITKFIGAVFTIPSHGSGWFMALFYPRSKFLLIGIPPLG